MVIKSIRQGFIYFFEPKKIADYNSDMMDIPSGHQSYSGKTYDIKLAHGIFKNETLTPIQLEYLSNICSRSPDLKGEIEKTLLTKFKISLI